MKQAEVGALQQTSRCEEREGRNDNENDTKQEWKEQRKARGNNKVQLPVQTKKNRANRLV